MDRWNSLEFEINHLTSLLPITSYIYMMAIWKHQIFRPWRSHCCHSPLMTIGTRAHHRPSHLLWYMISSSCWVFHNGWKAQHSSSLERICYNKRSVIPVTPAESSNLDEKKWPSCLTAHINPHHHHEKFIINLTILPQQFVSCKPSSSHIADDLNGFK